MSMLMTLISREESRNENMITEYTKELETLPKGKMTVYSMWKHERETGEVVFPEE